MTLQQAEDFLLEAASLDGLDFHSMELFDGADFQLLIVIMWELTFFSGESKSRRTRANDEAPEDVELDEGDIETHSMRVSKWTREACVDQRARAFWLTMVISNRSRDPITHAMRWFQTEAWDKERPEIGEKARPRAAVRYCQKANSIAEEWDQILETSWNMLFGCDDEEKWLSVAALSVLHLQNDFMIREVLPSRTYPRLLAWLVWQPRNV